MGKRGRNVRVLIASEVSAPSNKRLKLTGGDRSKGSGVLCPDAHGLSFNCMAPCGLVAVTLPVVAPLGTVARHAAGWPEPERR